MQTFNPKSLRRIEAMKNVIVSVLAVFVLALFTVTASAQSLDFNVQFGGGYANVENADFSNFFGQAYVGGMNWSRVSGVALFETNYDGGFHQRVYARGEVQAIGPTYAAIDTALNGEWDPRAAFGLNYKK